MFQIQSLKTLYVKGLRGAHLRAWQDQNQTNDFTLSHFIALQKLVIDCEVSCEDALTRIYRLSGEEALHVVRETRAGQDPDDAFVFQFA